MLPARFPLQLAGRQEYITIGKLQGAGKGGSMKKAVFVRLLFAVTLIACCPLQTRADMIALNYATSGTEFSSRNTTKGWAFTISSPVRVTQLGLWDQGNNGLNASHIVSIWTSTGTLMAQATIPSGAGATLIGGSRYVSITSVLLPVGSYTIGGFYGRLDDRFAINPSTITTASGLTYNGSKSASGFGFPQGNFFGNVNSYFGPNFQFATAVPTPDAGWTVSLLGFALLGLAALRRKLSC
jgi:protein with PEP-CTERM/exosortase system signal